MLLWISQQGNKFLVETNSIGSNAEEANQILMQFDKFEEGAAVSGSGYYDDVTPTPPTPTGDLQHMHTAAVVGTTDGREWHMLA